MSSNDLQENNFLPSGERLLSTNKRFEAVVVDDSYLAIRDLNFRSDKDALIWISQPAPRRMGASPLKLLLQKGGNLMLTRDVKAKNVEPVWQTFTENPNSRKPFMLVLQDDGRLFLGADGERAVWAATKNLPAANSAGRPPPFLNEGEYLMVGQSLASSDGRTKFSLTETGNVCIEDRNGKTFYYTGGNEHSSKFLTPIVDNGNARIQIFQSNGLPMWEPSKEQFRGRLDKAMLNVGNDGVVTVQLGSRTHWSTRMLASGTRDVASSGLAFGETWKWDSKMPLVSPSGRWWITLDADGAISLWKDGVKDRWWSPSAKPSDEPRATLLSTGHLEISDKKGKILRRLGIQPSHGGDIRPVLEVRDNGTFIVLETPRRNEIWNSDEISATRPRL